MSEVEEIVVPEGWAKSPLRDISEKLVDGSHNPPKKQDSGLPMLSARNIENGLLNWDANYRFITEDDFEQENKRTKIEADDVLLTIVGTIGRACVVPKNAPKFTLQRSVAVIKPIEIDPKFVCYQLQSLRVQHYLNRNSKGTAQKGIYLKALGQMDMLVAPPEQQKRIVAKIEELFSHIDAGIEALKKAKQLLKQYRQSVLKAAVTGELTKEWRETNKAKLEPATQLLERILETRRQLWEEQQLEQFKAKGKMPKDDKWKEKYKEPVVPDAIELPNLPVEWLWSGFEQVSLPEKNGMKAGPFGSALKKQFYVEKGYKIYGQEQVINNDPYFGDYYIDEEKYQSLINCAVKPGDFLISLVGTIGRTLVLPEDIEPGIINPRLIKITFDKKLCIPEYVQLYVASPEAKQIFRLSSHGGTMDVLNMGTLKALPLPLPPVSEQQAIVESVKEKEDAIVRQLNYVDKQMHLIEKSKQSILASAFSSKLECFKWQ